MLFLKVARIRKRIRCATAAMMTYMPVVSRDFRARETFA